VWAKRWTIWKKGKCSYYNKLSPSSLLIQSIVLLLANVLISKHRVIMLTSINLVFRSQCSFASIFYSTAYVFRIISFCFLSCILYYVACAFVICLIKYLLTYLLTYYDAVASPEFVARRVKLS